MRFDLEALRQTLQAKASTSIPTLFAAGGVLLATVVLVYGVLRDAVESPADAVTVTGPLYTPVAATPPPPPVPASRSSSTYVAGQPRFEDPTSIVSSVQAELKRAGCYRGPVNGVWTPATRKAMAAFTDRVNARLPVDRPDPVLLALLETHRGTACSTKDCDAEACAPRDELPARKAEVASIESGRASDTREPPPAPAAAAEASPDADDLGYSSAARRAPNPIASVQSASAESDDDVGGDAAGLEDAAAASAAGAAAHTVTKPKPHRAARKYRKKNSLSRQVSKGFRQIQRTLNKLF